MVSATVIDKSEFKPKSASLVRAEAAKEKAIAKKYKEQVNLIKERRRRSKQSKKSINKKFTVKRILKKSDVRVNMPQKRIESVLGDENRFFKNEYEQEKRSMFL